MKKKTIVLAGSALVVVACFLLVAASPVTAAELQQKGKSSQYTMNIAIDEDCVGKLAINTEKHTFVLNAEGCDPGAQYWMYYMVDASRLFYWKPNPDSYSGRLGIDLGTVVATEDGEVHKSDVYDSEVGPYDPMTIDDLSTIAVTKFAAGVYAQEIPEAYIIYPWKIGGSVYDTVTYQMYFFEEPLDPEVNNGPYGPFLWVWEPWLDPNVDITILDTDGNTITVTWVPPSV